MNTTIREMLRQYVKGITVETNVARFRIDDPFAETPPGLGSKAMEALKPKLIFHLGADLGDYSVAPAGEPSAITRTNYKRAVYGIGGALTVLLVWALLRKKKH